VTALSQLRKRAGKLNLEDGIKLLESTYYREIAAQFHDLRIGEVLLQQSEIFGINSAFRSESMPIRQLENRLLPLGEGIRIPIMIEIPQFRFRYVVPSGPDGIGGLSILTAIQPGHAQPG
jgi:hypothetical protein